GRRRGGKKIPTPRRNSAGLRRCNWRSPKAMRWAARRAASAPRPTWSVTAAAPCWRSGAPPARATRARRVDRATAPPPRPRRAGKRRWPERAAGDRGYSYAGVRGWLRRRHIEPVTPTRKDQPRDEAFDKATYRRRNVIERAVGWFKWCRALATRYDKLAV